jgi:hypothetical protein
LARLRQLLKDEASPAEQRIGRRLERADQRADATPINQPATRARLPDTAGTLTIRRAPSGSAPRHATKLAELNRTDASGQGRGWREHHFGSDNMPSQPYRSQIS